MKPLVDLCKRPDGIRCGPFGTQLSRDEFRKAGVPLWGIKHVNANFQFATDEFIEEATAGRLAQYDLIPGDLVMTRKGTIGNCAVYPEAFPLGIMHSDLLRLRLDLGEADPSFLVHQLHHSSDVHRQLASISGGAVMPGINVGRLKKLIVRVPPLAEQKRIAGILDAADALRAKRREALAQLDTLLQSIFLDMFGDPVVNPMGWEVRELNRTKSRVQIGPFGSLLHKEDYIVDGVPLVNPMHIIAGQIQVGNEQTVSEQKAATLSNYRLQTGDVVMARRGEMGRCAIVSDSEAGMLCGTGSLFFRPHPDELSSLFLARTLSSESMKRVLERLSQGVTMPNLNRTMVEGLKVGLPPLDLQRRFAAIVDSVEQQRGRQRTYLAELDTLFASLQTRTFRGDL